MAVFLCPWPLGPLSEGTFSVTTRMFSATKSLSIATKTLTSASVNEKNRRSSNVAEATKLLSLNKEGKQELSSHGTEEAEGLNCV